MHTYNNAIRRTVGSYVLYPGAEPQKHVFSLFDEILPGVGAFAIRPGIQKEAEAELKDFIISLIMEKHQISSRLNRLNYYSELVLKEPALANDGKQPPTSGNYQFSDKLCAIGYIRSGGKNSYYEFLQSAGLLQEGSSFLFYYYAIRDGVVYSHHRDISKAGVFRFYTNNISQSRKYHLTPIIGEIENNELISRKDLVSALKRQGYCTTEEEHNADYYYAMRIKVVNDSGNEKDLSVDVINSLYGNDSFSQHSPKVIPAGDAE